MTSTEIIEGKMALATMNQHISDEARAQAEGTKEEGNTFFGSGEYERSLECYEEAIRLAPDTAVYYSNASASCSKLGEWGKAALYAEEAIKLDPSHIKAYFRRATARIALEQWKLALEDLRKVIRTNGGKATIEVSSKVQECEKQLQKMAFEKAIHVDLFQLDMKHISAVEVECSYSGPRLEDDESITAEFCVSLRDWFKQEHILHPRFALRILYEAKKLFEAMPNVADIPVTKEHSTTVCGDIHGQFFDLCRIFEINDDPSENNAYLFNGDLVDRGSYSVEVILLLFAYKVAHPGSLFIARGNHESESVNRMHGFFEEVARKYPGTLPIFGMVNQVLNTLPLAHIIGGELFVVHGGLPMQAAKSLTISDIQAISRFRVPEPGSLMSQLLWSDPQDMPGISPSHRGEGILFGPDITRRFLVENGLKKIIRSHVWEERGYAIHHDGQCITIFSAPNYTGSPSKAAFIKVGSDCSLQFQQFDAACYQGKAAKNRQLSAGGIFL